MGGTGVSVESREHNGWMLPYAPTLSHAIPCRTLSGHPLHSPGGLCAAWLRVDGALRGLLL
jgi:hypothetical protein